MSDPNVSALSSEVEALIEVTLPHLRTWRSNDERGDRDQTRGFLRDLVRKALGTVEKERDERGQHRDHLAGELVRIEALSLAHYQRAIRNEEQARALAEALEAVAPLIESIDNMLEGWNGPGSKSPLGPMVRAALASWDTSQKESR